VNHQDKSERTTRIERGELLVGWARARLAQKLGGPFASRPSAAWCAEPGATFVTLHWPDGRLQGCIGSIEPRCAIVDDVEHNVIAAACYDPRARPVVLADVDALDIELSILSPLEPITFEDESSALAAIRPGVDGVVIGWQGERATFLPSMWSRLPGVSEFMHGLKAKAGLPPTFWRADMKLWRYAVDKYVDQGGRRPS
jgi:AmmeMemoRadiSam system protein A